MKIYYARPDKAYKDTTQAYAPSSRLEQVTNEPHCSLVPTTISRRQVTSMSPELERIRRLEEDKRYHRREGHTSQVRVESRIIRNRKDSLVKERTPQRKEREIKDEYGNLIGTIYPSQKPKSQGDIEIGDQAYIMYATFYTLLDKDTNRVVLKTAAYLTDIGLDRVKNYLERRIWELNRVTRPGTHHVTSKKSKQTIRRQIQRRVTHNLRVSDLSTHINTNKQSRKVEILVEIPKDLQDSFEITNHEMDNARIRIIHANPGIEAIFEQGFKSLAKVLQTLTS